MLRRRLRLVHGRRFRLRPRRGLMFHRRLRFVRGWLRFHPRRVFRFRFVRHGWLRFHSRRAFRLRFMRRGWLRFHPMRGFRFRLMSHGRLRFHPGRGFGFRFVRHGRLRFHPMCGFAFRLGPRSALRRRGAFGARFGLRFSFGTRRRHTFTSGRLCLDYAGLLEFAGFRRGHHRGTPMIGRGELAALGASFTRMLFLNSCRRGVILVRESFLSRSGARVDAATSAVKAYA